MGFEISQSEKTEKTEEKEWFGKLIDDGKWINDNPDHFKPEGKILYDKRNLERIKRFADAPMGYIEERIELNKEVSKSYHKLHQSILLAVLTGFYFYILTKIIEQMLSHLTLWNTMAFLAWGVTGFVLMKRGLSGRILRHSGLLKVIRDSEIEVYYLSKIREHRKSIKCSKCGQRILKDSKFCSNCGNELK